jgi:uncharacterized coiled-coil protein SlyX
MADEPDNHTQRLLREMREETNRRFDEMREEMREIRAQTGLIPKLADDVAELQLAVAATRADLAIVKDTVEDVKETARLIEGRLFRLEKHAGFAKA